MISEAFPGTWGTGRWRWRGRWWRGWSPLSDHLCFSLTWSASHPETQHWSWWVYWLLTQYCWVAKMRCMQQKTMFYNLRLGVGPDMALVLVLVVSRVTVVHTAGVVAHTGDGHPVGVTEDRSHGGHLAIIIWCSSECSQVLVEDVNSPGPLCTLSALYTVLCVTPISRASLLHPPAASLPPSPSPEQTPTVIPTTITNTHPLRWTLSTSLSLCLSFHVSSTVKNRLALSKTVQISIYFSTYLKNSGLSQWASTIKPVAKITFLNPDSWCWVLMLQLRPQIVTTRNSKSANCYLTPVPWFL